MNRIVFAFMIAVLCAGLFLSPAAAPAVSAATDSSCGDTYTVQHLDNLSKIARLCGTTVANILALNPAISNPNIIHSGQVLQIAGSAPQPISYSKTYTVLSGDTLSKIAAKFGITVWALKVANPTLFSDSSLATGQVLNIPIGSSAYTSAWYPRVTVSTTDAGEGEQVTVYVHGFPANSWIDYRLGESGEDYSVVYDGTIGSDGTTSAIITIPYTANLGEYWVVQVTTTSQKDVVSAVSAAIYINN